MLQGSLKALCPGGHKCPKKTCTGTEARQPHNNQPKRPRAASTSRQRQDAARPRLLQERQTTPCACGSKARSTTCPAAEESQTLTCFLHEVLIHGHNPLHGGGSISVERRKADQAAVFPGGHPADQQVSSIASEVQSCVSGQHYSQLITHQHQLAS